MSDEEQEQEEEASEPSISIPGEILVWFQQCGLNLNEPAKARINELGCERVEDFKLLEKEDFLGLVDEHKFVQRRRAEIAWEELSETPFDIRKIAVAAVPIVDAGATSTGTRWRGGRGASAATCQNMTNIDHSVHLWKIKGHQRNDCRLAVSKALREGHTPAFIAREIRLRKYADDWNGRTKEKYFQIVRHTINRISSDLQAGKLEFIFEADTKMRKERDLIMMSKSVRAGVRGRATRRKNANTEDNPDVKLEGNENTEAMEDGLDEKLEANENMEDGQEVEEYEDYTQAV